MPDGLTTWVIDTSSILDIRGVEQKVRATLYVKLATLVAEGRLKYPMQVVDELKRGSPKTPDPPFKWAQENSHAATVLTRHSMT